MYTKLLYLPFSSTVCNVKILYSLFDLWLDIGLSSLFSGIIYSKTEIAIMPAMCEVRLIDKKNKTKCNVKLGSYVYGGRKVPRRDEENIFKEAWTMK